MDKQSWKKSTLSLVLVFASGLLQQNLFAASDPKIDAVMSDLNAKAESFSDVRADITFIQKNEGGAEKVIKVRSYTMRAGKLAKNIIVASFPPDLKRISRLAHGSETGVDELWVFQPKNRRVKHLSPQSNATYFLGTEFTMEDWDVQQPQNLFKYDLRYLSSEGCGEQGEAQTQQCYVIERIPKSKFSGYSRQVMWIDSKLLRTYRIDFYDKQAVFVKTLRFDDYREYAGKYWRPSVLYMINKKTGGTTRAIWTNYQFNNGFVATAFDPINLDRYSLMQTSLKEDPIDDEDAGQLPMEVNQMIEASKSILNSLMKAIKSLGN